MNVAVQYAAALIALVRAHFIIGTIANTIAGMGVSGAARPTVFRPPGVKNARPATSLPVFKSLERPTDAYPEDAVGDRFRQRARDFEECARDLGEFLYRI